MATVRLVKETDKKIQATKTSKVSEPKVLDQILKVLPPDIANSLKKLPIGIQANIEEIRLRRGRPLQIRWATGEGWVKIDGSLAISPNSAYMVTENDLNLTIQALTRSSLYALEDELRSGYITICGGHRVGLVGEVITFHGEIHTLKNFSGLNLRLARSVYDCAKSLMPYLLKRGWPLHTLILSPPRCGKTTLLRDIIRQLSSGVPELGFTGVNVGVVDERSEIAGCWLGMPQLDVGPRTDVLDRCPKASGMIMLLRSMGPEVIATDEIGRLEELDALQDVLNAGVTILTSAHAASLDELKKRPGWETLLKQGLWQRIIILGRSLGPGTIEALLNGQGEVLRKCPWREDVNPCLKF
ncbi:MAG: stage sporulation protein [Clostridia bacterium]|nr:stage sporulation protein [Clostridia bacterium]